MGNNAFAWHSIIAISGMSVGALLAAVFSVDPKLPVFYRWLCDGLLLTDAIVGTLWFVKSKLLKHLHHNIMNSMSILPNGQEVSENIPIDAVPGSPLLLDKASLLEAFITYGREGVFDMIIAWRRLIKKADSILSDDQKNESRRQLKQENPDLSEEELEQKYREAELAMSKALEQSPSKDWSQEERLKMNQVIGELIPLKSPSGVEFAAHLIEFDDADAHVGNEFSKHGRRIILTKRQSLLDECRFRPTSNFNLGDYLRVTNWAPVSMAYLGNIPLPSVTKSKRFQSILGEGYTEFPQSIDLYGMTSSTSMNRDYGNAYFENLQSDQQVPSHAAVNALLGLVKVQQVEDLREMVELLRETVEEQRVMLLTKLRDFIRLRVLNKMPSIDFGWKHIALVAIAVTAVFLLLYWMKLH